MRKAVFALLAIFALAASFAAAQTLSPLGLKAADLNVAKNDAPSQVEGKAFGLKADKTQCACSADTLAKIEQMKKLLAELEQSCSAAPSVELQPPVAVVVGCVDKCLNEQKPYCEGACKKDGAVDSVCFDGCYIGIKQKCENSCNAPAAEEKPQAAGCAEECLAKNFDKKACLDSCGEPGTEPYNACYNECSKKSGIVWEQCQKQCGQQTTTSPVPTQVADVLNQCSSSCELEYSKCKQNCYAASGSDVPKLNSCVEQQCIPGLKQCSETCNSQYAPKPTFVQKVVNVFKPAQYRNAKWICHDGTESVEGGDTSCKPSETWSGYAKQACEGKCSTKTNKCGVNSFLVYNEC